MPAESYGFANQLLAWETIAPLLDRASPLRTAHQRDPVGAQIQFASESFIDEIAAAVGADPVAFRLRYLKEPRDIAVVKVGRAGTRCSYTCSAALEPLAVWGLQCRSLLFL